MPLHFEDLDVISEAKGSNSALIVPCNMCPAATVAVREKKLGRYAKKYETVIVLGCESATETVRDSVKSNNCKVVEGMKTTGIMNTKLSFQLPCDICFKDSRIIPLSPQKKEEYAVTTEKRLSAGPAVRRSAPKMLKILA